MTAPYNLPGLTADERHRYLVAPVHLTRDGLEDVEDLMSSPQSTLREKVVTALAEYALESDEARVEAVRAIKALNGVSEFSPAIEAFARGVGLYVAAHVYRIPAADRVKLRAHVEAIIAAGSSVKAAA